LYFIGPGEPSCAAAPADGPRPGPGNIIEHKKGTGHIRSKLKWKLKCPVPFFAEGIPARWLNRLAGRSMIEQMAVALERGVD
jgi:hypothetical protein